MKDKIFIDSNIFLYAFSDKDISKQSISAKIVEQSHTISTQVLNEVSNNMIKKLDFSNEEIKKFILSCYVQYNIIDFSKEIFVKASIIRDRYNISYYDSLIISSAIDSKCDIIYSEDMQHNQKIENLTITNPFK
ncbi:MAG: PIN domain-containing protein [Epsilonproteobacteria bacterium]|nr:PIN domain-containing protein [Campylobacterota bacterium]